MLDPTARSKKPLWRGCRGKTGVGVWKITKNPPITSPDDAANMSTQTNYTPGENFNT